jgi:uncharacterized phage protein (TIGR01671 family)
MMEDRFKFRAWDKERKIIDYFDFNEIFEAGSEYCKTILDIKPLSHDDYIWMQCTGLKDKNGKLIFEGDIISPDYFNVFTGLVYWENGGFFVKNLSVKESPRYGIEDDYIIIGNKFENPDLLKTPPK